MTRNIFSTLALLTLALWLGAPSAAIAAESYDSCTGFITTLPVVIASPGNWCLKQDIATAISTGNAIDIQADNVSIDCNDFKIGGLAAGLATQTNGIYLNHHLNATIRRCNIRGFYRGLDFETNGLPLTFKGGHLVEDNRFDGNTFVGIAVSGDDSVVRRNQVLNTGGSTASAFAAGIITGNEVDVLDNTVSGVSARSGGNGSVIGIDMINRDGSVSGNRVRGLLKDGTGKITGIANDLVSGTLVMRNNVLVGDGTTGSIGLKCSTANGRAKNNTINGFVSGLSSCSDDGGNVTAP